MFFSIVPLETTNQKVLQSHVLAYVILYKTGHTLYLWISQIWNSLEAASAFRGKALNKKLWDETFFL